MEKMEFGNEPEDQTSAFSETKPRRKGRPKKEPKPLNIYTSDAEIAHAFKKDCEKLLQDFSKRQCFGFLAFAELWRQRCFAGVFDVQECIANQQVFIETAFLIARKFLKSSDLYTQVGGIYLLYSLYFKQPLLSWVKIRLTCEEAMVVQLLLDKLKSLNQMEPVFVWTKLRVDGAFQYIALAQAKGVDERFVKRKNLEKQDVFEAQGGAKSPYPNFVNFVNGPLLAAFEKTDTEYQSLMRKCTQEFPELMAFPTDIAEEARRILARMEGDNSETLSSKRAVVKKALTNKQAMYRGDKAVLEQATTSRFTSTN